MAEYILTIDGVERQARRGSLRLLRRVNVRPTLELEVQSLDGTYVPPEGADVLLTENGAPLFGGRVQHPSTGGLDGQPDQALGTRIDCVDNNAKADDLYLRTTFPGGTIKAFFQWTITNYLGPHKGTTLDPLMPDGPVMPAIVYTYRSQKRVSDGLTDACKFAVGWTWTISPTNVLSGRPPDALPAPFAISDGDPRVIGDVRTDTTSEQYANRIIVAGRTDPIAYYKDVFTDLTDGTRTEFPLRLMPVGDYPHFPNAGVVYVEADAGYMVAETFGMLGAADSTWQYDPDANKIIDTGNAGGIIVTAYRTFPLPLHRPMWIIYDGIPEAIAIAEDLVAQDGPKGIVERVIPSDLQDQAGLDAQAQAELIKALATPQTIVYDSDELGLAPGQIQTVIQPWRHINGQYVIQQVETRDVENVDADDTPLLRHTVTAVEYLNGSTAFPGTVGDLFTKWGADRTAGAPANSPIGEALKIPGTDRQMFFNDAGTWGAAPDVLHDKNGSGAHYGVDAAPARQAVIIDAAGPPAAFPYTSTPAKAYPPSAAGVSLTPNGSAWVNSAYVTLIASTPAAWTLAHLAYRVGAASEFEFDIATGTAGSEVVIATLAGYSGTPSFTGMNLLPLPIPYGAISAGTRIAIRLRMGQPNTTPWRVGVQYFDGTPAGNLIRSTVAPVVYPPGASGAHVTPSGTPWANGAYVTAIAATAAPLTVAYLTLWAGTYAESAYEIDLAYGAVGAETVVATVRGDTAGSIWDMGQSVLAIWPLVHAIPVGVRVALRIRKAGTSTADWWIKIGGYLNLTAPELTTARAQVARPAAANSPTLTTSGTAGVPGAWVEYDAALSAAFAVCAIIPTGAAAYQIDIDVGYGPVGGGSEILATTFRASGDSGNGHDIVRLAYARLIPAGARLVARAVGLDVSAASRGVSVAIVGILSPDFLQVSTAAQSVWPDRINGIGNPQVATSWTNSAWAPLVADSGATAEVVTGLAINTAFGDESELDIGLGTAGAEVVATTIRLAGEGNASSHHPNIAFEVPLLIPAHSRVSYRTRRNANTTTQSWTVAALHTPAVTSAGGADVVQTAIANRTAGLPMALTVQQTNDGDNYIKAAGGIHVSAQHLELLASAGPVNVPSLIDDTLYVRNQAAAPATPPASTAVIYADTGATRIVAKLPDGTVKSLTSVTEAEIILSDVTTANASTTAHGFLRKLSGNANQVLDGSGAWSSVTEAKLSLSDVTTANASTTAHGLLPKLPNDATKFLNGVGAWAVPAGGGGATHYDAPLTDGDPVEANLIFAGGDCVIVQVPV